MEEHEENQMEHREMERQKRKDIGNETVYRRKRDRRKKRGSRRKKRGSKRKIRGMRIRIDQRSSKNTRISGRERLVVEI